MTDKELPELTDEEICDYSALYYTGSAIHYVREGMRIYRNLLREKIAPKDNPVATIVEKTRMIRIRDENLSVRVMNICRALKIETLEDLLRYSEKMLKRTRQIGRKSLAEIEGYVSNKGYKLGMLAPIWFAYDYDCAVMSDDWRNKQCFMGFWEARDEFIRRENEIIKKNELL